MDDAAGHSNQLGAEIDALVANGLSEEEAELIAEHRRSRLTVDQPVAVEPVLVEVPAVGVSVSPIGDVPLVVTEPGEFELDLADPMVPDDEVDYRAGTASVPFGGHSRWLALAVAVGLALISGLLVRLIIIRLTEGGPYVSEETLIADFFLATLPFVIGYFAWLKRAPGKVMIWLAASVAVLALAVNLYPLIPGYRSGVNQMTGEAISQTGILSAMHLPVVLWLLAGLAYTAIQYHSKPARHSAARSEARMIAESPSGAGNSTAALDFIRFTGEWVVFLILTWLVGGTIIGLVLAALNIAGVEFWRWGMGFSILIAMLIPLWLFLSIWLTELTRNLVSKMLSVLTWVFTPIMLAALVLVFTIFLSSGTIIRADRDLLMLLDGVLIVVLALVLYSIAARNPNRPPGVFDWLQLIMIGVAVVMNIFALIWMVVRLADFGWTANRAAALGLNLILVVNLAYIGWLLFQYLRGSTIYPKMLQWQSKYLPVFAIWAAVVVLIFPLLFSIS